jgi:hypothetical protein
MGGKISAEGKNIFFFHSTTLVNNKTLRAGRHTRWGGAMMMINLRNFPSLVCSNFSCNNKQAILSTDFALTFQILYSSLKLSANN